MTGEVNDQSNQYLTFILAENEYGGDSLSTVDGKMAILLDVDRLVSTGMLEELKQVRH
ncbi:MAG: hypothetical protein GY792_22715 [Gammaproteobacteria bacterium]|nr:hypothetical protein [Gammaproteobacteria bacterium]MCP4287219.1 hypothetical protein [Gammaproteobacteria bacterium]